MKNIIVKLNSSFAFWEAFAKGCNWLLLATLPFYLSEQTYGTIALLSSYLLLISNVGIIGQNKVILRFVDQSNESYIPYNILISSVTTIVIFIVATQLLEVKNNFLIQLFIACILFTNYSLYIAYARKVFDHAGYAKIRVGYALSRLVFGLSLLWLFGEPVYYLYAEIISIVIGLFIVKQKGIRFFKLQSLSVNDNAFKKSIRFGSPLIIHSFATFALAYIDRIILGFYLTNDDVGRYVALYTYAASLSFIYAILTVSKEPEIYKAESNQQAETIANDYLKLCLSYGALVALFVSAFYYVVFVQLKGVSHDALIAFGLVILAHLVTPFYFKMNYLLARMERTSLISLSSIVAAMVNITLNILLIPMYGIIGAAMTTVVSYLVLYGLTSYFYYQYGER